MDYRYFEEEIKGLASKCIENEQDWASGGEDTGGEGESKGGGEGEGKGEGKEGKGEGASKEGGEGKGGGGEKKWYAEEWKFYH